MQYSYAPGVHGSTEPWSVQINFHGFPSKKALKNFFGDKNLCQDPSLRPLGGVKGGNNWSSSVNDTNNGWFFNDDGSLNNNLNNTKAVRCVSAAWKCITMKAKGLMNFKLWLSFF